MYIKYSYFMWNSMYSPSTCDRKCSTSFNCLEPSVGSGWEKSKTGYKEHEYSILFVTRQKSMINVNQCYCDSWKC